MANSLLIAWLIICVSVCSSCGNKKEIKNSFYHWQLQVDNTDTTLKSIYKNEAPHKIYMHIMDLGYDATTHSLKPISLINATEDFYLFSSEIVPVIFIENSALLSMDSSNVQSLAIKILQAKKSFDKLSNKFSNKELQIDCDWTLKTRDKYFALLTHLKSLEKSLILSATIRLYPYKYKVKMGVPPVDYGVLMCYNMDNIKNHETVNSIFHVPVLNQYLGKKNTYPIKLKPALPIYGWCIWYRAGGYQKLLYFDPSKAESTVLRPLGNNRFVVLKDTMVLSQYLRIGDELRNEYPDPREIKEQAIRLGKMLDSDEVIFFHWNAENLSTYTQAFN